MKKLISLVVTFSLALMILPATATSISNSSQEKTLGEIEAEVLEYFDEQNIDISLNSPEYIEYIRMQVIEDADQNLRNYIEEYDDFCVYASEYLLALEDILLTDNQFTGLPEETRNKTANDIREEVEIQRLAYMNSNSDEDVVPLEFGSYNPTKAVAYAKKYALDYNNLEYPAFSILTGGDCTNFVSQCLFAGGIPKDEWSKRGVVDTTNLWYYYNVYEEHAQSGAHVDYYTTSWIRVADLYEYLDKKGLASIVEVSSIQDLYKEARIGDIVQLSRGGGNYYHSIIITAGSGGNMKYCGHTTDRYNYPLNTLAGTDVVEFRVIHPYQP